MALKTYNEVAWLVGASSMNQYHNLQAVFVLPTLSELIFHNLLCV